jgi:hypothetical protein
VDTYIAYNLQSPEGIAAGLVANKIYMLVIDEAMLNGKRLLLVVSRASATDAQTDRVAIMPGVSVKGSAGRVSGRHCAL